MSNETLIVLCDEALTPEIAAGFVAAVEAQFSHCSMIRFDRIANKLCVWQLYAQGTLRETQRNLLAPQGLTR